MDDVLEQLNAHTGLPLYMSLMRLNVTRYEVDYGALEKLAASLTDDEVVSLLASHWRDMVMGAWFSIGRKSERVADALLASLAGSDGSLTSPPLAIAATLNVGTDALPAMRAYLDADLEYKLGAAGFVGAAIEHLGGSVDGVEVSPDDRIAFDRMLSVGMEIARLNARP